MIVIYVSRVRMGYKKTHKKTKDDTPPASPVVWTRLVDRVDPMRRGDNIYRSAHRAVPRASIHACARVPSRASSIETRSATTRRLDRSHPFVRSVVSIRSHRILSRIARVARDSRRPDRSPIRPSGRRVGARIVDRGLHRRIRARVLSRSTSTRSTRGVDGTCRFSRVFVRSRDADADAVDDDDDEGDRARARSIDARDVEASAERRGDRGGFTSRDSWTRDDEGGSTGRGCKDLTSRLVDVWSGRVVRCVSVIRSIHPSIHPPRSFVRDGEDEGRP